MHKTGSKKINEKYMKNLFTIALVIFFLSCDPVSDMEANIENLTSQSLTIDFISQVEVDRKTLHIQPNEIALFQAAGGIGSSYLEPSLIEYDSVVIMNQAGNLLKVFKADDAGKNIYRIDDWQVMELSGNVFLFEFEIENEDIK